MIGFLLLCLFLYFLCISPMLAAHALYKAPDQTSSVKLIVAALNIIGMITAIYYIYLSIGFYLGYGLIINEGMDFWQAFKTSLRAIESNRCRIIALLIIKLLFIVAGVLTCGIGLIWALPYCYANYGVVYDRMFTARRGFLGS